MHSDSFVGGVSHPGGVPDSVIVVLAEKHRLMQAIDDINFLPDSKSGSE